jgi:aminomethyltransferase
MMPFAGYEMPVQYPAGVMKEHLHTRDAAGLFDVSHMGQILLFPKTSLMDLCLAFEGLMPVDVCGLAPGRQRYGLLTNPSGGILDDLMFANHGTHLYVVVNAACKHADFAHLQQHLSSVAEVRLVFDRALLAIQGPKAVAVLAQHLPQVTAMSFMDSLVLPWGGVDCWVSRSGYTGEDGFEISIPDSAASGFAQALLADPQVLPVGLGARDSLRLEAGLCLFGHDIDAATTPVEAALAWSLQKSRRVGGPRVGGYPGADVIAYQLQHHPERLRVGLSPQGRAPMREGTNLFGQDGTPVGQVTSGGFGPSVAAPIAMGYVRHDLAVAGTTVYGEVRGKMLPVTVTTLPFISTTYKR